MSPPDLPPTSFYRPLRELLAAVRGGGVFRPTTPEDIKAGKRPPAIHPAVAEPGTGEPASKGQPPFPHTVKSGRIQAYARSNTVSNATCASC